MKIRTGFVSNSSSSSFICDVCNTVEIGMDASIRDFEMSRCKNDHTFCNSHGEDLLKNISSVNLRGYITKSIKDDKYTDDDDKNQQIKELCEVLDEDLLDFFNEHFNEDDDDGLPEICCPICTFTELNDSDAFGYLKKKFNLTDSNILNEIKADFKSYDEFNKWLTKKD